MLSNCCKLRKNLINLIIDAQISHIFVAQKRSKKCILGRRGGGERIAMFICCFCRLAKWITIYRNLLAQSVNWNYFLIFQFSFLSAFFVVSRNHSIHRNYCAKSIYIYEHLCVVVERKWLSDRPWVIVTSWKLKMTGHADW